jgi:nitrite reductase/ring-hydroxylating ferredoxin subunit
MSDAEAWQALPSAPAPGTPVCLLAEIADGSGRMFAFAGGDQEFRLLVLRSGATCLGYVNRCPHFGVPLAARDDQLILSPGQWVKCNTHYARFRWQDGYCDSGDCEGESLLAVPLHLHDGSIRIGTGEGTFPGR